jgi:hypothetical protein
LDYKWEIIQALVAGKISATEVKMRVFTTLGRLENVKVLQKIQNSLKINLQYTGILIY